MLVCVKLGADFSRGCAHPAMLAFISATHPSPLDSRIDSCRYALALLRQSGFLLVVNTGFREDFFSPTLGDEHLPSSLRPHPGDTLGMTLPTSKE